MLWSIFLFAEFFRSTVRVWTLAGDIVYTLTASTAFIFCLAVLPSGDIVTGGEDRAVSVWRGVFYFFMLPLVFRGLTTIARRRIVTEDRASCYLCLDCNFDAKRRHY
jgi:hypothetical protein